MPLMADQILLHAEAMQFVRGSEGQAPESDGQEPAAKRQRAAEDQAGQEQSSPEPEGTRIIAHG
jgi:hypothetical protein